MNLLILYDSGLGRISAKVRGENLLGAISSLGHHVSFVDVRGPRTDMIAPDVVYLIKVANLDTVKNWKASGASIVFDLNDALWRDYHRVCGWGDLEKIIRTCDGVIASNRYLAEWATMRGHHRRVEIVEDAPNVEAWDALRKRHPKPDDRIRFGWVGTPGTFKGIDAIWPQIEPVVTANPVIEWRMLGRDSSTYTEQEMMAELLTWHFGLFPISIDIDDYVMRGDLKAKVYMAAGAYPICWDDGEPRDLYDKGYGVGLVSGSNWDIWLQTAYPEVSVEHNLMRLRREFSLDWTAQQLMNALERLR